MFLEELVAGQKVKLIAKINNNILEFDSTVKMNVNKKHMAIVNVVKKDDKLITFKGNGLIVDMICSPEDDLPIVFKNVSVSLGKDKDDIFYIVQSIAEGKSINRRQNYRVYVGQPAIAQFGLNRKTTPVVIKDVSSSGFAVIVKDPNEQLYKELQTVHVVLNDRIEETAENYSFHLYGTIVRVVPLENNKGILYGCSLYQKVVGLEKYLTTKERIRLKNVRHG